MIVHEKEDEKVLKRNFNFVLGNGLICFLARS